MNWDDDYINEQAYMQAYKLTVMGQKNEPFKKHMYWQCTKKKIQIDKKKLNKMSALLKLKIQFLF